MGLENTTNADGLNPAWPLGGDPVAEADNHLRLIKTVLQSDLRPLYPYVRVSSFQAGAVILPNQVLLDTASGKYYHWEGNYPPLGYIVPAGSTPATAGGIRPTGDWVDVGDASALGSTTLRDVIRRSYASVGLNLVEGSFSTGGVLTSAVDVLFHDADGKAYAYKNAFPHTVAAGSVPTTDFISRADEVPTNTIKASALGLVSGAGNGAGNAEKLLLLNTLTQTELIVDNYYEFTSNVTITRPNKKLVISGKGELHGINAYLTVAGSTTAFGVLTASEAKGARKITVADATGISVGDTICIHNQNAFSFSAHRTEYTAGEYNVVMAKAGNQLTLKNPLMFDYTSLTNIKLFKLNLVKFEHWGVTLSMEGNAPYVARVLFAEASAYDKPDVVTKGASACAAALVYEKCPSVSFDLGDVYNDTVGTSTQYGISFSSCWDAVGRVKNAYGYRHGVTTGSDAADCSIPCKNILVTEGSVITNNPLSGIYAADFHGNTIDSYYKDCIIYGDIGLAGENVGCPGSTVYAYRANYGIDFHEIVGGVIDLSGVKIKLLPTFNFDGLVGFSASGLAAKVDRPFTVKAHGVVAECKAGIGRVFNLIYNQASAVSGKSIVDIDGITLTGDPSAIAEILRLIQQAPGIRPDIVRLKNVSRLTDAQKYVTLVGAFQGCVMSLPAVTSQPISLSIAGGGWFSSSGGTGGYALHTFPGYPVAPQACVIVENQVRAESPKIRAAVESIALNNITAYISTENSGTTIVGGSTKLVRVTALFENMVLA